MNAEIVAIGTELFLGQIANTNAQRISKSLAEIGVGVYFHTVVGDNMERMIDTLTRAIDRSDVVIVTGGLGPTPDDITREAIAQVMGVELVRSSDLERGVRDFFERRGREMPEDNVRQADIPKGAEAIAAVGTAPGFWGDIDGTLFFALPGVPWEMDEMMESTVLPELKKRSEGRVIHSRHVLVMGLGESITHERIREIVDAQSNPTIAYLASWGQVRVRITALANSVEEAERLIEPVEAEIRERLGKYAAKGDHETIAEAVGALLKQRGETMAATESLTGGLIGEVITETEGSSEYFLGSLVTYSTDAKRDVAGVDPQVLEQHGAVSPETAKEMARASVERFGADIGIAATGVAGPLEQEGKPVGLVYVGVAYKDRIDTREVKGYGDRESIRRIAANSALDFARRVLEEG